MSIKKPKVIFSSFLNATLRHNLLKNIQDFTEINEEGAVSWSNITDVDQYIEVLGDAFIFPDELSRHEKSSMIFNGVINARKSGNLTDSSILKSLQQITDEKLDEPLRQFSMWSRLSYHPNASSRSYYFNYEGVSIRLSTHLPKYMQIADTDFLSLRPISTKDKPGSGFLISSTRARNSTQAADKIFSATEIFQALYNLALRPWNIFGSEQKPEATLLMGPYHFLFQGRKSLHKEITWFNQNFRDEYWNLSISNSDKIFKSAVSIRSALAKLQNHPLKGALSSSLLMMNDGMEASDMSRRTLRYWTALERLFQNDDERVAYEKIVRRATYLDHPADLVRAKLNRLMRIRNRYVHMGTAENEHHQLTQYLADHIKSHLFYLLFNGDDFSDHAEFIEMTDLPSDSHALQRRRRAIDRRERMLQKRRHRAD